MTEYQEYRRALVGMVNSIDAEVGLEEENTVLLLHLLNNELKIIYFNEWVKSKLDGETLQATETEICRAAVHVSKTVDIIERLWDLMEERQYPKSIKESVVETIECASEPLKTAEALEPLVEAAQTLGDVAKAVQQFME